MPRSSKEENTKYWKEYNSDPDNKRKIKNTRLKNRYGISLEEFESLVKEQEDKCKMCGDPNKKWHLDHDHDTGEIRGVLCHKCNIGLHYIETQEFVENASRYLGERNTEKLQQLSAEFPPKEVKQRVGRGGLKLDYISIDTTINRLNEVLSNNWDAELTESKLSMTPDGKFLASVSIQLKTLGSSRGGVGASIGTDPDDTLKTAEAEALKKAANLYGVSLYLWDESKRGEIAKFRATNKEPRDNKELPF